MDEQPRGTEMPRSTLRKFMNDPKSSVMGYLAENMAAQQIQQHLGQQSTGSNGTQQNNSPYGQQYQNSGPNGLSSQFQNHNNASQTSLNPSQAGQNNGSFQSIPSHQGQGQTSQIPSMAPYLASNVGGLLNQASASQHSEENGSGNLQQQGTNALNQQQDPKTMQNMQNQHSDFPTKSLGMLPPTSGMKHSSSPQSAPRLYHRMNLDFEASRNSFFNARAQHNSQEMTSAAYDLESLSRRIWTLRYEHALDFQGYEETGHRTVIAQWQAQYEMWADTVLDIQEGDSAASMFAVHRTPSTAPAAMGTDPPIKPVGLQATEAGLQNSFGQVQQPSYQEMDLNLANQTAAQSQPSLGNQGPGTNQRLPINQGAQVAPPSQYLPPGSFPGGLPVSGPLQASQNSFQQPLPMQQQSMNPPPQQMTLAPQQMNSPPQQAGLGRFGPVQGQNRPPPNAQNGPQAMASGPQNNQNFPQNNQPNIPLMQNGQPQQSSQQMQDGPPPNAQQSPYLPYTAQRTPSRPNSINPPPQGPMSQPSLGQNQPPRPEGFPQQGPPGGR